MKLTLRLADRETQTGQSRTLESGRLTIGRGTDNDWVLPDPDRTLSKNHCRIDASEGGFMLTDLSTNGVFLAGAPQPVGRGQSCVLEDGDVVSLGPYRLHAEIGDGGMASWREPVDADPSFAAPALPNVSPLAPQIPEPWLADVPSGGFGPDRRAAPQGWDRAPDPATYAATGQFELPGSLGARILPDREFSTDASLFSQTSEHIDAASTVMRLPEAQVVLPTDWMESDPVDPAVASSGAPRPSWPPTLPPEPQATTRPEPQATTWPEPQAATWPEPQAATWPEPQAATWPPVLPEPPPPPPSLPADWVMPASSSRPAPQAASSRESVPALAPAVPYAAPAEQTVPAALPPVPMPPPVSPMMPQQAAIVAPPHPVVHPMPAAPPPSPEPSQPPVGPDRLLRAFLEGAGLPPGTLDAADPEMAMREIGQMVRAAVGGVREIMSTRALVKSEFRVDQTVLRRADNNAVKFAPDIQRCLAAMVGAAPPGFLPGPSAMKQSMDDIKAHELALVAALNSVFADMGQLLDPEIITHRARQDTSLATMLPYAREAKCWAIYVENYRVLQESGAANAGGSLLAPLAKAYARQLRRSG